MDYSARIVIRNIIMSLIGIGLAVLVIVLLIRGFTGGPAEPTDQVDVSKYAYDSSIATLLADGPTVLDQEHYQVRISVSSTQVEIDIINGYQGNVVKTQSYANNGAAYNVFLQSLQRLGYSNGVESEQDYRGFCPTGQRYLYSFSREQDELFEYWQTSCGEGTFKGNGEAVRQLFQRQIPPREFSQLIGNTKVRL